MASNIHNDFDNETDLSKSFDAEPSNAMPQAGSVAQGDTASTGSMASLGRAILQGALPFEDRAVAGAKTGLQNIGLQSGSGDYNTNLAMIRQRNAASEENHPLLTGAGKIAGATAGIAMAPEALLGNTAGVSGAANVGARLGAVEGLSGTQDLTASPLQDVKNAAIGAGEGAGTGVIASGIAGAGSALLNRAGKTKMVQSMLQAARVGKSGADVVGSDATANLAKQSENRILNDFLPKIKSIEADLTGSTDPVSGVRTPGQYDQLYEAANKALPNGVDAPGLAAKVSQYQDMIESNPGLKAYYEQNGGLKAIQAVSDALEERAGNVQPQMTGELPEGMLPPAADTAPMSIHELRGQMDNLQKAYDANPENNKAMLDLKKIFDAHMDDTLDSVGMGDAKDALDAKYARLQNVKDTFGIKNGMTGIEPQKKARDIATMFEKAAKSDPNSLNDVAKAGNDLISLSPDIAPTISSMADDAETASVSKSVNRESPIANGIQRAHLSGHAVASNIGLMGGKVQGAVEGIPGFSTVQDIIKGATNLSNTNPEAVTQVANHMMASENPISKRMGGLLNKVATDPDPGRRRALMFSLSQQPAFREAVGNVFQDSAPEEQTQNVRSAPIMGGQ